MNKKISFQMWATIVAEGLWQGLCHVAKWFNPKYKSPFWRVIWCTITVCLIVATSVIVCAYYKQEQRYNNDYLGTTQCSNAIRFYQAAGKLGYIAEIQTHKPTIDKVEWIAISPNADSLAVFSKGGKRGYFNRYNGKEVISPRYDAAWVFSEGLAAVSENGKVYFIDHAGKPIMENKVFPRTCRSDGYCFHGNYCPIATAEGKVGLINKHGDWAIQPEYDNITAEANNFWIISRNDKAGVVSDSAKVVFPCEYEAIRISADGGIAVTQPDYSIIAYDFDGTKRDDFICTAVSDIYYITDEINDNGEFVTRHAANRKYTMPDGHEGLLGDDGKPITSPLYWDIQAIDYDTYQASYQDVGMGVILNRKGEVMKHIITM
jgi:hypothetical protein